MRSTAKAHAWLLCAGLAGAQSVIQSLSFGNNGDISRGGFIPGWQLSSVNHEPQLLSDRLILTPPVPGNAKGALWSEETVPSENWSAQLSFRASGQDVGSGNLQIWYTKDKDVIGSKSVYNADNFDGMVLVIDQYGGRGGSVRGFLNDGSQNFRTHSSLESLAFGHCEYSYRNLGRPSTIQIRNQNGLTVTIDDQTCFSTDKVSLPAGYHFGLTASTADNPDTFEIYSMIVSSEGAQPASQQQQQQQPLTGPPSTPLQRLDRLPRAPEAIPDSDPEEIKSQTEQFADLHNRLQGLTHQLADLFAEFSAISTKIDEKHDELSQRIRDMQGSKDTGLPPEIIGTINRLSQKVDSMDSTIKMIKRDVESKDYRVHLDQLTSAVERVQGGLAEHLPERIGHLISSAAPRMGRFVFIVLAVQIMLAGAYVVYKRRRNSMPKKYL